MHGSAWVFACAVLVSACLQADLEKETMSESLDRNYFRCEVEPVLIKRCAFVACHGDLDRPLRLYAPHRLRGLATPSSAGQLSEEEHQANFEMAQAFAPEVDGTALLLRKPLAMTADGYFHLGAEIFAGGDSFLSTGERGYQVLSQWTQGQAAQADCVVTEGPGL